MKNNLKIITAFVIGILVSGIGVYATNTYLAKDVIYKNSNVEDALDNLYNKLSSEDKTIFVNSEYYDQRKSSNTVSIDLEKGKYICNAIYIQGTSNTAVPSKYGSTETVDYTINDCEVLNKSAKYQYGKSVLNSNNYIGVVYNNINLECNLVSDKTITVSFKKDSSTMFPVGVEIICNKTI